jgi:hypothetical protein
MASKREYEFVLVLTDVPNVDDGMEDALFEAGCDDSTICIRSGRVYLAFSRVASSLKGAVLSAIRDVKKAGLDVLRVDECNLVTQAEIAHKIKRTRQLVHQYITGVRGPGKFPAPACQLTETAPLWYWCEVAQWLRENNMISEEEAREAWDLALINSVLEFRRNRQLEPAAVEQMYRELLDAQPMPPRRGKPTKRARPHPFLKRKQSGGGSAAIPRKRKLKPSR